MLEEDRRRVLDIQGKLQGEHENSQGDDPVPEASPEDATPAGFLLTGTSFLFTWNIGSPDDPHAEWLHFLQWRAEQAVGPFKAIRFSATMEESLRSEDADRVHIHEQREVCKRLTRVSLEPFSYTATTGHVVRPNCAANYLEATGSSSADGTARGRGAAYRAQPATGHISMSKPTNMARCLQKQIGPCKQISGCRQNGLMTSLPEANSAETNGSSMQLIPPLGSVLGSAILKLWRCTKRRRPWNATHQSFGKRSPPCALKSLGAQTCSNKPRQAISPYFGSSFVGLICFPQCVQLLLLNDGLWDG